MNRRKFIKVIGISSIFISIVGYFTLFDFLWVVKKIISQDTMLLRISEGDIDRFINEAVEEDFFLQFSRIKKYLIIVHFNFGSLNYLLPYKNKYLQYRSQIAGHFLLSTNIFSQPTSLEKKVSFVSFFNPFTRPCSNPFSDMYFS
jgi:hypothetical protein